MAPNADGTPTPEEQAATEAQMKAPREPIDPDVTAQFDARLRELEANLTEARARADAESARASAAEAKLLDAQQASTPRAGSRQIPLWYVIKPDHAAASGDIKGLVDDVNTDLKDVPGFKSLTVPEFLALNSEVLDNDARARGFDRGARWSSTDDNGATTTGYHLFSGATVLAGTRDASAAKPASGNVNATVVTK